MSSGFGNNGMQGRCYSLWQDFSQCMSDTSEPQKCFNKREDYMECLHHRKEITRYNTVMRTGTKNLAKANLAGMPKTKAELIGRMKKDCNAAWVESARNVAEDKKFDEATVLKRVAERKSQCTAALDKWLDGQGWDAANPEATTA